MIARPVKAEPAIAGPMKAGLVIAEPVIVGSVIAGPMKAGLAIAEPVIAEPMKTYHYQKHSYNLRVNGQ